MFGFCVSVIVLISVAVLALLAIMNRDLSGRSFADRQA